VDTGLPAALAGASRLDAFCGAKVADGAALDETDLIGSSTTPKCDSLAGVGSPNVIDANTSCPGASVWLPEDAAKKWAPPTGLGSVAKAVGGGAAIPPFPDKDTAPDANVENAVGGGAAIPGLFVANGLGGGGKDAMPAAGFAATAPKVVDAFVNGSAAFVNGLAGGGKDALPMVLANGFAGELDAVANGWADELAATAENG